MERTHEPDVVSVGVFDDRVPRTPEGIVRGLKSRVADAPRIVAGPA
jgi:hypothetical protein